MSFPASEMCEEVQYRPKSGQGAYGPIYGPEVTLRFYLEPGFKRVVNAQGEEVTTSLFGIGAADTDIGVGGEITWQSRRYEVIEVQPLRPAGATHHIEVYFKSAGEV